MGSLGWLRGGELSLDGLGLTPVSPEPANVSESRREILVNTCVIARRRQTERDSKTADDVEEAAREDSRSSVPFARGQIIREYV